MKRWLAGLCLLLLGLSPAFALPSSDSVRHGGTAVESSPRSEQIRQTIEAGRAQGRIRLSPDQVYSAAALPHFYEDRGFEPAWTGAEAPLPAARTMLDILCEATLHGLRPSDYHVARIEALLAAAPSDHPVGRLTTLDLLLTDGALLYASHLASGKTDPTSVHPQWRADRPELDAATFLAQALADGTLRESFAGLEPPDPGYGRLMEVLERLRRIAASGGWEAVPRGPALQPGEVDARVPVLRAHLRVSGDLAAAERAAGSPDPPAAGPHVDAPYDPFLYDSMLVAAVERFQARHGLSVDGVVGGRTLAALAVPVERRIDQVLVNLERWRWLPRDLGERHVRVNIAGFELQLMDRGKVALSMRVIVGKQFTMTPVFSGRMTYLVLNPAWWVPASIAGGEMLPKIRTDPQYLARGGYEVLDGTGPSARVLDPATIDWASLTPGTLSYVFRQRPGPDNSLGRIKFMFPNPYSVYLHDTPEKSLFDRNVRAFSHGCIRLERAFDLATALLKDDPAWPAERLEQALASGEQQTVLLPQPLPVHIQYWTAWVDADGTLELRDDIYRRDDPVLTALRAAPPAS